MTHVTLAPINLADVVHVRARFGRSVNIERDFYGQASLDGYVFTTTAHAALRRISLVSSGVAAKAWTLIGPYGAGKSAFALFTAKCLGAATNAEGQLARNHLKAQDKELWGSLFDGRRKGAFGQTGLCPILITGSRESIGRALLRGLATSIECLWVDKPPALLSKVRTLLAHMEAGKAVQGKQIVKLFEEMAQKVCTSRKAEGLLIIVDELGKLLEYASANPHENDIFVLQELAEATKQNTGQRIFLITILHQAFEHYAERLGRAQKEEWKKVQGRFEDIPFQEPIDQLLRVLSKAIEYYGSDARVKVLHEYGNKLAYHAQALGLCSVKHAEEVGALASCMPLHPTVALLLSHLYRRIGQNERSLFAFLTSQEPYGFQEFISKTSWQRELPELLRLDVVYNYINAALGSALYAQADGKKWAEIDAALNRLVNPTDLEIRIIKAIGLLRVVGDIGELKSSMRMLKFAFESEEIEAEEIEKTLERLQQRSVIIYRRYTNTFALWEGSDIDIETLLKIARRQIDLHESLASSLTTYFKTRPIVARRHSLQTGTLRYFDIRYVDLDNIEASARAPLGETDGRILYGITVSVDEMHAVTRCATSAAMENLAHVIFAIPQNTSGLREAIYDVACLRWIQDNTPELEGDRAARNELQARLLQAEGAVEQMLQSFIEPAESGSPCLWYHKGKRITLSSRRALQEYISALCDEVFSCTPVLRNELINRRQISGSATSARRELISAMITNGDKPLLGIKGYPPQMSMYFSLLQETTIHREENGIWGFFAPNETAHVGIIAVWQAIDDFLRDTEMERRTVKEFFDFLKLPPYGIKAGPLPVILAAVLLHLDTELALYEQGSFVPSLSIAVFERLFKAPEKFQVQRSRIAGVRTTILERYAHVLLPKAQSPTPKGINLLTIVRPLTRFATGLPNYTKSTQRLSDMTLNVRNMLFTTREPDKLLFDYLPEACGVAPFVIDDKRDKKEVGKFFKRLRKCISELQHAYDNLLNEVERLLVAAFSLKSTGTAARLELQRRAYSLPDLTVDPKLKSFLLRVLDNKLDYAEWLESIATLLGGKPPASWYDTDLARYEMGLSEIKRSFQHIEVLFFEIKKSNIDISHFEGEILRLGITIPHEPERQRVITISKQERSLIEDAQGPLEQALADAGINGNKELRLAVLAKLSGKLLIEIEEDEQKDTWAKHKLR